MITNTTQNLSLSYSFKKTLEDTHKTNQTYVSPDDFRTVLAQNPLFAKNQANDAKDFVNYMIMTMHQELNKPPLPAANNDHIMDKSNFDAAQRVFMQEFCCNFRSFISDIYYAVQWNITECLGCRSKQCNFQAYFFLVFPLEEVRIFRNQYLLNLGNTNMTVTLNDCFLYNAKYELFTDGNQIYCNNCRSMNNAAYNTKLFTVPKTLILLLSRGKGIEYKVKLEFTEYLDQYTIDKNLDPSVKWIYKRLSSVVTHLGENGANGHFVAHTISQTNGLRYLFNDATVSKDENFKKEVIDFGMPYLLFYTNMDPHDMLRFILNRVTYTEYRDSISNMFESLKPEQQSRFAYLLMRAADNDAIMHAANNDAIRCWCLSNLICATFELIKTGKSFDDDYMEECRIIICELEKQIQKKLSDAFSIDNIISLMNSNTFSMITNKVEEGIIYFKVYVVNSTYIKQSVINNQNEIINNDNISNQNFINNNQNNNVITNQNGSNKSLYSQNSKYDPYASESPKYNSPSKKSKLAWLKFALAVIFAIATIVLIVLELYLIALIPFVCMFAPFIIPKLCESCCGHVYTMDPLYENELDYNDNYPDNNKDYQQESPYPYNHNPNIIENNQIQN
ncbi:MAG: hypothetical protein IJU86_03475 [Firmicutes bacterium]|nr:hypothetical protein [Bacillota bacterium]